ncbi:flagella synthesis protein FlgN [Parapusillimonas granuli]|uniref:Flagellar protein FlgN n=1 Tax=Parapusillimonas granuli TaxID=380911 RepID=A0A853G086_9BURK|nr:flagellar protein FlgN [Parapusillimonas granuli]MBB5213402.1 flagella synthesis protein FlgN [Parapusillimonas granuli]MEB2398502.1 flagellar protein FlgN [Alcaligenaceae bacterium]NYT48241.1 flagellar protein FlgN [Parapusillimonas granuli]
MNDAVAQLEASLQEELGLIQEFNTVLEAEAEALTAGNDDALAASTARKNQYAERLAEAGRRRNGLLGRLGYEPDQPGLDAACAAHPSLRAGSRALLDEARRGRDLNTANGILIDTFLAHNQQTLDALRQLAGIGDLYDAKGRSRSSTGKTRNIKA